MVLSSSPPAPPGLPATRLNGSLAAVKPYASAEPGAGAGAGLEGEAKRASRESGLNREGGTSQRCWCASVILQGGGERRQGAGKRCAGNVEAAGGRRGQVALSRQENHPRQAGQETA